MASTASASAIRHAPGHYPTAITAAEVLGSPPDPLLAVQQLLLDLRTDRDLQDRISALSPQQIVSFCKDRGVYVSLPVLRQFVDQSSHIVVDESADEELTLEQLSEVAGGRSLTSLIVSGALLAVVASNAAGFLSPAQAGLTAAAQSSTLETLGVHLVVGQPAAEAGDWDPSSRTLTVSEAVVQEQAVAEVAVASAEESLFADRLFLSELLDGLVAIDDIPSLPLGHLNQLGSEVADRLSLAKLEMQSLISQRSDLPSDFRLHVHRALADQHQFLEAMHAKILHHALFPNWSDQEQEFALVQHTDLADYQIV